MWDLNFRKQWQSMGESLLANEKRGNSTFCKKRTRDTCAHGEIVLLTNPSLSKTLVIGTPKLSDLTD